MTIYTKRLFFIVATCLFSIIGNGQTARYTFDDCGFDDKNGNYADATAISFPTCACGLNPQGLYFDGNNDNLNFPEEIDSLMEEDFTLSFYFQIESAFNKTDIISVRNECSLDSFMALGYNPSLNLMELEMATNISDLEIIQASIDLSRCWHRAVITKSGLQYSLYIDDEFSGSVVTNGKVRFAESARLSIANSPCIVVNQDRFNGYLDEFEFYTRALSLIEIRNSSLNPDMIVTNDTTIVAGDVVDLEAGTTCANSILWTPSTDLDDPNILNPIATPSQTTTYYLTFNNDFNCSNTDSVTIYIINPDDLDCENLLLPNAFTPNDDFLNDTYGISSLFLVDQLEYFEIYDRWGAKMWNTTNKNDMWDGTFSGNKVNPGMYLYKVKYTCRGSEYVKVDNFSVLR